ncbi:hypothetical protein DUNSADRAFT_17176 [Dunaliella salina]|uniref:Ubiquitin-like domain-containing protein n=1 Tax=Dunaliella salina TaxID=3046 RepID=A0ABQ7G293_DUNSA|nr:hypothetical protein DUNSADRAFT_17176 [Dunaliella salina]|eukprot:KAF5828724.1 hypothetical protein DUNSADRAFT_17176 [Dunaliella salina]
MSSAIPSPSQPLPDKFNFTVKLLGAGVDGTTVPVRVKSTGTVADVITQAVHNLHAMSGPPISFANLRVTGLFSESGRMLAPGYRLHSQNQVPFIKDGATLTLKVFY